MKRKLAFLLALLVAVSLLAACGSSNPSKPVETESVSPSATAPSGETASPESEEGKGTKNGHVFYDPPITLNLAKAVGPEVKFKPDQDINNNEYNDWLLDEFGIKANYTWTTPTADDAFYTKLMLSISAGEKLPEFFTLTNLQAHELIDSGLVMPIDDLYEKYAGKVWKAAYDEIPNSWLPYRRDGKTYAYPLADYSYEHEDVMWIRQDWLDAVNMKAPTNLEELRAVMDAFIHLGSDVTGQDKVYGFAAAMKGNYITWDGANPIFGGFGTIPEMWLKDDKGEIVYSSTLPQVKEALGEFKSWIEKGYFSPEAVLMDEMKAAELFTSGRAGIVMGPTWLYSWPLRDVETNVPGAKVGMYPIPAGPTGTFVQQGNDTHFQVVLFSKEAQNPQAFFEVTNFMYDNWSDPPAGSRYQWGFKEGYDYVMTAEGLPSYKTEEIPNGAASIFPFANPTIPSQKVSVASYLASGAKPETPLQISKSIGWDQYFIDAAQIVLSQKDSVLYNLFNGKPTPTMVEKMSDIRTFEEEVFSRIMNGDLDINEGFDTWLTYWNENGGPEITQEVRDWYKAAGGE